MNFKLLEKLVRLANNNPNENEANLAARKVCKLIEDANFKFVKDKPVPQPSYNDPLTYDLVKDMMDELRRKTTEQSKQHSWNFDPETAQQYQEYHQQRQYESTINWDNEWTQTKSRICSNCKKEKVTGNTSSPYICKKCRDDIKSTYP